MTRSKSPTRRTRIEQIMRENFIATTLGRANCTLQLKLDHQSFYMVRVEMTKAEVKWFKKQMAIALCRFKFGD